MDLSTVGLTSSPMKTPLTAGNPLEPKSLQRKDETSLSVNGEKISDWAISSQAPNRGRFRDYPTGVGKPKSGVLDTFNLGEL